MQGSKRIVAITREATRYKLPGVEGALDKYRGRGSYAIRRNNIVLVSGSHARGTTAHIFLENGDDILEVYGITGGQPGWTEYYDWIHVGSWCDRIEELMCEIEKEVLEIKEIKQRRTEEINNTEQEKARQRLLKFECQFSK